MSCGTASGAWPATASPDASATLGLRDGTLDVLLDWFLDRLAVAAVDDWPVPPEGLTAREPALDVARELAREPARERSARNAKKLLVGVGCEPSASAWSSSSSSARSNGSGTAAAAAAVVVVVVVLSASSGGPVIAPEP